MMTPSMNPTFSQTFSPLFAPFICLALAVAVVGTPLPIPVAMGPILPYLAYVAAGIGGVLALRFRHTRALLVVGMVAFTALALDFGRGPDAAIAHQALLLPALAILIPFNVLMLTLCEDRGAVSGCGTFWTFALAVQGGLVAFVAQGGYGVMTDAEGAALFQAAVGLLHLPLLPNWISADIALPDPAVIAFALAGLLLLGRLPRSHAAIDGGILGALVALGLVLNGPAEVLAGQVLTAVAAIILIAALIQDAWRMAFIDDLTGLPGRRALEADCRRLGRRYVTAMLDIDHFKHFNDTYGHDVGDQVLRLVAAQIGRVRGGGRAYRYGGEEFTILFPGKTPDAVKRHLESVRAQVAAQGFTLRAKDRPQAKAKGRKHRGKAPTANQKVAVTVSIGYAERAGDASQPGEVLKAADQALYRAKKAGRNRLSR